ncbi:MAG: glycosyltransferase family 39 protein [Candidatus Omnitrophica bacterium]|nr:glycosyltransferase family 39 protein [Candidatus Omnitrophota bacterium]
MQLYRLKEKFLLFLKQSPWLMVIFILLVFFIRAELAAKKNSLVTDESGYIYSGYYYYKTNDFALNNDHPPLLKLLVAYPLVALDYALPLLVLQRFDSVLKIYMAMDALILSHPAAEEIVMLARTMNILFGILLGIMIFLWARRLYGAGAALFSLFLYTCCPNILANAYIINLDIGLACFFFMAVFCFWLWIKKPGAGNTVLAGLSLGLAISSKSTGLLLLPVLALLFASRIFCERPSRLSGHLAPMIFIPVIALVVLNAAYFFKGTLLPLKEFPYLLERFPAWMPKGVLGDFPLFLPADYLNGLHDLYFRLGQGYNAILMGKSSIGGWPHYHITAFLIKTTLPVLILLVLSAVFAKKVKGLSLQNELFLIIPVISLFLVLTFKHFFNIGLRYLLPVYPFIFVYIGKLVRVELSRARWKLFAALLAALCAWHFLTSLATHPHYISYFNELIGGAKNGHKYLVDSNLDIGQDFKYLKDYLDKRGIQKIKLLNFYGVDPALYGISYELLREDNLEGGIICVGASTLEIVRARLRNSGQENKIVNWLDSHKPIDIINYTILIYKGD